MLGAAQADPARAEFARLARILGRVGVGPHAQPTRLVRPAQEFGEPRRQFRGRIDQLERAADHDAAGPVDRESVAFLEDLAADGRGARAHVDLERLTARHARQPHPASDDGGVRGRAALRRQHALRGDHPVDVVGRSLLAHQQHRTLLGHLDGRVGIEGDRSGRGARRSVEAFADDVVGFFRVDPSVEELVQRVRIHPPQSRRTIDQLLANHVERNLDGGLGRPFCAARLQHV